MKRARFVIDTNVLVSGLLTRKEDSPVARVVDGMLAAAFPYVVSQALLAEYLCVLRRPALCKLHGLTIAEIEELLVEVAQNAIVLEPRPNAPAPDTDDQLLWDLLAVNDDLLLVTGDRRLLEDGVMKSRILSPRDFVTRVMPEDEGSS